MSKRMIWALSVGAILIAIALAAYGLPPQEICEPAKQIGHEQCATYSFPLFAAIQVGEFLDLHNGLIIAVFTGTLWWSTHRLWTAGERQLRHSEDTAKRQLRAYLDFHNVGWDREKTPDGEKIIPRLRIRIMNYGQTPASEVSLQMRILLRVAGMDDLNILTDETVVESWGGIAPRDYFTKRAIIPLPDEVWQGILRDDAQLICQIAVSYLDVFEERQVLESDFKSLGNDRLFSIVLGTRKAS